MLQTPSRRLRRHPAPILLLAALLAAGCEPEGGEDRPDGNLSPQTHVSVGFFRADSSLQDTLGLTASRVGLSWWGEDPDGWIDHYRWRWAGDEAWQTTLQESDTFIVRLTEALMTVRFEVQAVDNEGLADPTPAAMVFPAYNQKPRLDWVAQSQELLDEGFAGDTSWTFAWNTFHFNAWDLDGNETIVELRWALDDTTAWQPLELGRNSIALGPQELAPGPHRVFVQARDIAQAWSEVLSYPRAQDTTATGQAKVWMVRPLAGDLLVAYDDPANPVDGPEALRGGLSQLGLVEGVDYTWWDVTRWLPYDDRDFEAILGTFRMAFWISWRVDQLERACTPLDQFMVDGGRVLVSSTQVGYFNTNTQLPVLYDNLCLPIDSLRNERQRLIPPAFGDHPITPTEAFAARYPLLHVTTAMTFQGSHPSDLKFGFVPDDSASVELYFVPADSSDLARYPRATLAARRPADHDPSKAKQVYFSLPIHKLDDLPGLFNTLIYDEFDW
jgi:hypothetical protein